VTAPFPARRAPVWEQRAGTYERQGPHRGLLTKGELLYAKRATWVVTVELCHERVYDLGFWLSPNKESYTPGGRTCDVRVGYPLY